MPGIARKTGENPMRPIVILLLALSACAESAPQSDAALRARQEAACTATIMDHINHRPRGEVSTKWVSAEAGIAQVEVRDGTRLHLCHVDATGHVLGYDHPGA